MSTVDATIRPARPDEAATLMELAIASKAYWGYDEAFMQHFAIVIAVDPAYVDEHDVWIAETDGEIAGFHALIDRGEIAVLDHLWLSPVHIGRGLGRLLFEHALRRATDMRAHRMEWEAEPYATGFYERMGAMPVREVTSEMGRQLQIFARDLSAPEIRG